MENKNSNIFGEVSVVYNKGLYPDTDKENLVGKS